MPLLDHFHPPLRPGRNWESFHGVWAGTLMSRLNQILPTDYFAEIQIHLGSRVEVDIATLEREPTVGVSGNGAGGTATAVAQEIWAPPAPALVMPAIFPDEFEVQVLSTSGGLQLVAAVELVSPANKDRPETRREFAAKCISYLQVGVGLVIVDVVTERTFNMHDEIVRLLDKPDEFLFSPASQLYAVAYRPVRRKTAGDQIDLWPLALTLGQPLPTMPLALRGGPTVPLDLEATYTEARQRSRL